jgi:hypothetical protein
MVEPSAAPWTAGESLVISLAGLLVIEEHQEAQAVSHLPYYTTDAVATLAQELGGLTLEQPHIKHDTRALVLLC